MNRILLNIILLVTLLWLSLPVVGGKSPDIALQSLSGMPIDSLFKKGEAAIDSGNRDRGDTDFHINLFGGRRQR